MQNRTKIIQESLIFLNKKNAFVKLELVHRNIEWLVLERSLKIV